MSNISIVQNQQQNLKLNASLKQSIEILQMSSIDLDKHILQEYEKNPFLVVEPSKNSLEGNNSQKFESHIYKVRSSYHNHDVYDNISKLENLKDKVLQQILITIHDTKERFIAFYITDLLNDNGYIQCEEQDIIKNLKISKKIFNRVLNKLQTLEPSGIFARNVEESLALQLQDRNLLDPIFKKLLLVLKLIPLKPYAYIAKKIGINIEDFLKRLSIIQSLDPKPGRKFATSISTQYKFPDIILKIDNGELFLNSNNDILPVIKIDKDYYQSLKSQNDKFINNSYINAKNLLRNINYRSKTLLKVASTIASKQRDFFLNGIMYFKPMILSEIAYDLQLNESTISRAIANKYISSPLGIHPIKFFFSSKIASKYNDTNISSTKVKEIIKTIITSEDSQNSVVSDQQLATELKKFNINIARRTVAKYREMQNIPSSAERKRVYKYKNTQFNTCPI